MVHVLVGSNDDDYEALIAAGSDGASVSDWVVPKDAKPGEPVLFFIKTAGFVAEGTVDGPSRPGTFGKKAVRRAAVGPVVLLATPVPIKYVEACLPTWGWATYTRSYTSPPPEIEVALRTALEDYQDGFRDLDGKTKFTEGKRSTSEASRYERDPKARAACIAHYGAQCFVCDFSYEETYGPAVAGLILVHHLTALAASGVEHDVDPVRDLRPVCADCHLVMHRRNPPFTVEEVQAMLLAASEASDYGGDGDIEELQPTDRNGTKE